MKERRKKVVLCKKLFNQIRTSEGFGSVIKRINGCLTGLEKRKMDDMSSQMIKVFNGKNEHKKDMLINLLESLNRRIHEELMYWVCYNCGRKFSYRECDCKIKIYEGLTARELFEKVADNYNLSFGEILEKSKRASIILCKENGILGGLIHLFRYGIPSMDKTEVQ